MTASARPLQHYPLFAPPPRRWRGPIIDAHMHSRDSETLQAYWDVAEPMYGIHHVVCIVDLDTGIELRKRYGDRVEPAVWGIAPRKENFSDMPAFRLAKTKLLEEIAAQGFKIVKLWFTPRFHEWSNLRLDDPCLDFFFDRIEQLKLAVLIHVADPDYWFSHRITDLEEYGSKAEHYGQLAGRMERHPGIIFQTAHFAGHPEDLDHLHDLLCRHPNLYLDSSATKWISREYSKHREQGRDFLVSHSDRVLFGTDLVANPDREKEGKREHYATRFYVHQLMWEGAGTWESPIDDEDSTGPPIFHGLELPEKVLRQFYWENAARLYGFKPAARSPVESAGPARAES